MDRRTWERVEPIFDGALQWPPGPEREAYLNQACEGEPELRRQVDALLESHEEEPGFLETPLVQLSGEMEGGPSPVPTRIGPYRLVRLLGRGGMGEVHLAVQEGKGFERHVALKVIRRGMATEEVLRRFRLERRILASLKHPNIAALLDGGATADGWPYVVMEYVDGVPVDEHCRRRGLGVAERLRLFQTACDAVQHAHRHLVVHRDIKPANILVTDDDVPKLLDFGIGKLLDPDGGNVEATRTGVRVLTPSYASPEQIRGERVTAAGDVYQLGVLLFELLTGRRPFGSDDTAALERAILDDEPPRPSAVISDPALARRVRGDLDNIVLMALRKEPNRRYASATALSDDVERHLEGLPVRARAPTPGYRLAKFVRRNPVPVVATVVVIAVLSATTVYSTVQSRWVAQERDRATEVQGFLLEMFGASGPDQATGDTVTARQVLDRQVESLEGMYAGRPELRARMAAVLAEAYDRLGLHDDAEALARRSLDIREASLAPESREIAASLNILGWVLHQRGESEAGEALLRRAIPIWRDARPRDVPGLSRALNDLGVIRDAAGEHEEAARLYQESLELRRRHYGDAHRSVAVTASNLAVIRYRQGRYDEAEAAAEEALTVMRRAVGGDHQRSIIIQHNLAAINLAQGDAPGAEAVYRDLIERQSRIQGPDHPITLGVRNALASTLTSQRKFADAESVYRELLGPIEARSGGSGTAVATILVGLAENLTFLNRGEEAIPLLERALTILGDAYGEEDTRYARALERMADARAAIGDDNGSETLHRRAVELVDAAAGPAHPEAGLVRLRFAHRLLARDRNQDALAMYEAGRAILTRALPETHRALHETRLRVAQAYLRLGGVDEADSLLAASRAALAAGGGDPIHVTLQDSLESVLTEARRPR